MFLGVVPLLLSIYVSGFLYVSGLEDIQLRSRNFSQNHKNGILAKFAASELNIF